MADRSRWTWPKRLAAGALALAALLAFVLLRHVPSNEELAARLQAQAEAALGVPVHLGAVRWQFSPLALVIEDASTGQPAPIRVGRIVAQPVAGELLRRQLRLQQVTLQDAVLPQLSLRALRLDSAGGPASDHPLVERLQFQNLTWLTRQGVPLVFDGHLRFDAGWRPREGELARSGAPTPTRVTFQRAGDAERWQLKAELGGGSAEGEIGLTQASGGLQLAGHFTLHRVEVQSALAAFQRNSVLRGLANGRTEVSALGAGIPELMRSLTTRTRFTMAPATLLRIDVDKAIRSFGQERAGQTRIASLSGHMETQNSAEGVVFRYRGLEARGESFVARGAATIANRRVNGEGTVDLAGGLVGVPLKVSGPLAAPEVAVPRATTAGAVAGAAIGTAVLPGVGTVLGAGVGATLGKLLGGEGGSHVAPPAPRSR